MGSVGVVRVETDEVDVGGTVVMTVAVVTNVGVEVVMRVAVGAEGMAVESGVVRGAEV